jgi:hypothetical protein
MRVSATTRQMMAACPHRSCIYEQNLRHDMPEAFRMYINYKNFQAVKL